MRIGVVQPLLPPRVRVTFGRKNLVDACGAAMYPMAVAGENTFTAAASDPPAAVPSKLYSPSARQPTLAELPQSVAPATPFSKRGSKAPAAFAAVMGPVKVVELPPPSGVKARIGATGVVPRFCTTIVL